MPASSWGFSVESAQLILVRGCSYLAPVVLCLGKLEGTTLVEENVGKQLTSTMKEKK